MLKPFDPTCDNGPELVEYALACERVPAGEFWWKTMDFGSGEGGHLFGVGRPSQSRAVNKFRGHPVTVLRCNGDRTKPGITVRRAEFKISDIGLSGGGSGTIIEVTQLGAQWPVGGFKCFATLMDSDRGVYFAPEGGDNGHGDHAKGDIITSNVKTPLTINEVKSVDHVWEIRPRGNGDTIIDCKAGGKVKARVSTNGYWRRLLTLGDDAAGTCPNKHNGDFRIELNADGGDRFQSLLEERFQYEYSQPFVSITGFMSTSAVIGSPPILLNTPHVSIHIDSFAGGYHFETPQV